MADINQIVCDPMPTLEPQEAFKTKMSGDYTAVTPNWLAKAKEMHESKLKMPLAKHLVSYDGKDNSYTLTTYAGELQGTRLVSTVTCKSEDMEQYLKEIREYNGTEDNWEVGYTNNDFIHDMTTTALYYQL